MCALGLEVFAVFLVGEKSKILIFTLLERNLSNLKSTSDDFKFKFMSYTGNP
jgi:hypothetical protein